MTKLILLINLLIIICNYSFAQIADTLNIKSKKGFIFIPAYHFHYDFKKCCPGEIIPGYNDYFFQYQNQV